ncbi:hypothetical protein ACIBG7_38840 [Nonomuraea sp. NPDC050328]|uniref:hypothetical protein n=1 Tax=Nonomuraea sp. NPDC050328 TaxID=3364361 RepID=UPI0037ABC6CF
MEKWFGLFNRLVAANGGKMNGKLLVAVIMVALIVVGGFIAFRLLLVDMILELKESR